MSVKSKTGETAWVLEFWSSGGYDEPLVRAGLISLCVVVERLLVFAWCGGQTSADDDARRARRRRQQKQIFSEKRRKKVAVERSQSRVNPLESKLRASSSNVTPL